MSDCMLLVYEYRIQAFNICILKNCGNMARYFSTWNNREKWIKKLFFFFIYNKGKHKETWDITELNCAIRIKKNIQNITRMKLFRRIKVRKPATNRLFDAIFPTHLSLVHVCLVVSFLIYICGYVYVQWASKETIQLQQFLLEVQSTCFNLKNWQWNNFKINITVIY